MPKSSDQLSSITDKVDELEKNHVTLRDELSRIAKYIKTDKKSPSPLPPRSLKRTIFVRMEGDDTNTGDTPGAAFRQIKTAVDSLAAHGPLLLGKVFIDVGPGIYEGGIRMPITRGTAQEDFVRIVGSNGSDGRPTSIIKHSAGTKTGVLVEDGSSIWLENLMFTGAFQVGVQLTRNVYGWFTNVHVDGENEGARGFSISSHCRYYVKGGRLENLTYAGIDEYFNCARSFATVNSWEAQMLIRNCRIGVRAKEGCVGHFDYLTVEDCEKGIELIQSSVANFKKVALNRNRVGLALVNSSSHNEETIAWGEHHNANAREVYSAGASGELRAISWSGDDMAATTTVGHRPLFVIANDFVQKTVRGSAASKRHEICFFPAVLPLAFIRTQGKHFRLVIFGQIDGASAEQPIHITATVGAAKLGDISISQPGQTLVEFDSVATDDANSSLTRVTASVNGSTFHEALITKAPLAGSPSDMKDVGAFLQFSHRKQSFRFDSAEMWG